MVDEGKVAFKPLEENTQGSNSFLSGAPNSSCVVLEFFCHWCWLIYLSVGREWNYVDDDHARVLTRMCCQTP